MPTCLEPGCPALVPSGRCAKHQKAVAVHYDRYKRGNYGRPWRRRRMAFIQSDIERNVWCAECLRRGEKVVAEEVDHIVPHRGDQALRDDPNNLQSLCKPCHSAKTAREVGFGG